MRKFIWSILSLIIIFSLSQPNNTVRAEEVETPSYSIEDYKDFLQESGELQALKEYELLSVEEQQKVLDYMLNPAVLEEMFEAESQLEVGETVSLHDGDIVISKKPVENNSLIKSNVSKNEFTTLANSRRKAEYTANHTVAGYATVKIYTYVNYEYSGSTVKKATSTGGDVTRNVNPILTITKGDSDKWVSNNKAYGEVYWNWKYGVAGYGYTIGTRLQTVWGTADGRSGGSTKIVN